MARLDAELVRRGIARSRQTAKEMIKSGRVTVNGIAVRKPSLDISESDILENISSEREYVGRGAYKLKKACEVFGLDFTGMTCIDIGASTGGFTEYMLLNGAERVYAVDVGSGQLAESLRLDSRVVNLENTDIRNLSPQDTGGCVDFISADVSFISLEKILPQICNFLKDGSRAVVLIKPQFEAGRENIGKGGIVKDRNVHRLVLERIHATAERTGLCPVGYTFSPIRGGSGNVEYLAEFVKSVGEFSGTSEQDFQSLVSEAFGETFSALG